MKLGTLVASEKLRKQGARQGLPTLERIIELLS
jgi:sugar/nucleoside kinase (ribokinase family)